jgi:choline dehydrogenase
MLMSGSAPAGAANPTAAPRTIAPRPISEFLTRCGDAQLVKTVVPPTVLVHGISGLRIADASVMPSIPSANTAATVYAIAERAVELIGG